MENTLFIPTNDNMVNYYFFREGFTPEMIEKLDKQLEGLEMIDGNTGGVINKSYRSSKISWIPHTVEWNWLYEYLCTLVKQSNEALWNFDITHMGENIQYTEYDAEYEGHYDWHLDIGPGVSSRRKISISIQLSDPEEYEGGDLQFSYKRDIVTAPKNKGSVVLFPSFFLHRIVPVTRGKRRCLVLWVSGIPFH